MKHWLAAAALTCFCSAARAQGSAAPAPIIPGWYKLHWTPASSPWQFGLDASLSAGVCLERELHDGQFLAGPCRDVLLLAKDRRVAFHLGVAAMSNAERGNTAFQLRLGANLGPVGEAALRKVADRLPFLERLADWKAPPFLGKLADATTLDFMGGPRPIHDASVNGPWTYGVGVKVDIPLDAAFGWLKGGL